MFIGKGLSPASLYDFFFQGYNGWTNGQYGYSWDMMVHAWHTSMVVIKVVDKDGGNEYYLDPNVKYYIISSN